MADKKPEAGEGEAPAKPKSKLLLFIIIGALVVVLGGGAGAYFLLKKKAHADDEEGDEPPAKAEKAKKAKMDPAAAPVFVKLDQFVVKLQVEQQEAYLQTTPQLRVSDPPVADRVKQFMPEIRHRVTLILMSRKVSDLNKPEGVQKLSNEIRVAINLILDGPKTKKVVKGKKGKIEEEPPAEEPGDTGDPDDSIQSVLFDQFIIQ
jgi:flagellar FliL protein